MTSVIQIKRTINPGAAPPPGLLAQGELAVEMATLPAARLWVGVPTTIDSTGRRLIIDSSVYLPINGSIAMTGPLTLSGNPSSALHAVPQQWVQANYAPLASPGFTGTPTITGAPPPNTDASTRIATTQFVANVLSTGTVSVTLTGDVSGTGTGSVATQVLGWLGRTLTTTAPTANQIYMWSGTNWTAQSLAWTMSGDVTGTAVIGSTGATTLPMTVTALQGRAVYNQVPTANQVLTWDGTNNRWYPATSTGGGGVGSGTGPSLAVYPTGTTQTVGPATGVTAPGGNTLMVGTPPDTGMAAGTVLTSGLIQVTKNIYPTSPLPGTAMGVMIVGAEGNPNNLQLRATGNLNNLYFARHDGSMNAKTALAAAGEVIGEIMSQGWNGTAYINGTNIVFSTMGVWGASANTAQIQFWSTPTGTTMLQTMTLTNGLVLGNPPEGDIGFGSLDTVGAHAANASGVASPAVATGWNGLTLTGPNASQANIVLNAYAAPPVLALRRIDGVPGTPSAVANETVGQIAFSGWNGAGGFNVGASIIGAATEPWTSTASGSQIYFITRINQTTANRTVATLGQDGSLTLPYAGLVVGGPPDGNLAGTFGVGASNYAATLQVTLNTASAPPADGLSNTTRALRIVGSDAIAGVPQGPVFALMSFGPSGGQAIQRFYVADGTAAAPLALGTTGGAGNIRNLGGFQWYGWNGSNYIIGCSIVCFSTGNIWNTTTPENSAIMRFQSIAQGQGGTTQTIRMAIGQLGGIMIGASPVGGTAGDLGPNTLNVQGNAQIGANLYIGTSGTLYLYDAGNGQIGVQQHIFMANTPGGMILWPTGTPNPPTFTTRSTGTKLMLYPSLSGTSNDYAIGVEGSNMWFSANNFKWYNNQNALIMSTQNGALLLGILPSPLPRSNAIVTAQDLCAGGDIGSNAYFDGANWRFMNSTSQPGTVMALGNVYSSSANGTAGGTMTLNTVALFSSGYFTAACQIVPWNNNAYQVGTSGQAFAAMYSYAYVTASDPIDKRDIEPVSAGALDTVRALDPVTFCWSEPPPIVITYDDRGLPSGGNPEDTLTRRRHFNARHHGFLSTEVRRVMGEDFGGWLPADGEEGREGIDYAQMTAVLWKAVQELSAEVEELKSRRRK